MNGNSNQYDPTTMFRDWIQKSGQAQSEFMKSFGSLMTNQSDQTFNPLETLRDVLSGSSKIMIDQNSGNGVVPYLPLNELNKNKQGDSQ